jgi:hypothetical protein
MEPSRPYRREGAIKPHFLYRIATKAFTILQRPERKFPLSQGTGSVGPFRASNRPLLCPFSPLTARIKCVNGNTGSSQRPLLGLVASSVPWVQPLIDRGRRDHSALESGNISLEDGFVKVADSIAQQF